MFFHRGDERAAAGHFGDAVAVNAFERGERQAFEKANAFAQGGLKFDFAAHGAGCDVGNFVLEAEFGGQLVDAFLLDDGGIHVGNEQQLAAVNGWLDAQVDFGAGELGVERGDECGAVIGFEMNVAGEALAQPIGRR